MYKSWSVEDIRKEMKKMDRILGKKGSELPIKINTRMTRSLGMYKFKIEDKKIVPVCFEFSTKTVFGEYDENTVIGIIRHEYAHYAANDIHKEACGHDRRFKNICELVGAPGNAVMRKKGDKVC